MRPLKILPFSHKKSSETFLQQKNDAALLNRSAPFFAQLESFRNQLFSTQFDLQKVNDQ
jgi:hypothetical protein